MSSRDLGTLVVVVVVMVMMVTGNLLSLRRKQRTAQHHFERGNGGFGWGQIAFDIESERAV